MDRESEREREREGGRANRATLIRAERSSILIKPHIGVGDSDQGRLHTHQHTQRDTQTQAHAGTQADTGPASAGP